MKRPLALLLLLALCCGCASEDEIEPVYDIPDESYVVVFPCAEPEIESAWDSQLGHEIAEAMTEVLTNRASFRVVPYRKILNLLDARNAKSDSDEDIGPDVRDFKPAKVAKLTVADYVVVARILHWQLKDPLNVNVTKATATAEVMLFRPAKTKGEKEEVKESGGRTKKEQEAWEAEGLEYPGANSSTTSQVEGGKYVSRVTVTARFPDSFLGQEGGLFMDPVATRQGLIKALAAKAAELYFTHPKKSMPGEKSP